MCCWYKRAKESICWRWSKHLGHDVLVLEDCFGLGFATCALIGTGKSVECLVAGRRISLALCDMVAGGSVHSTVSNLLSDSRTPAPGRRLGTNRDVVIAEHGCGKTLAAALQGQTQTLMGPYRFNAPRHDSITMSQNNETAWHGSFSWVCSK